MQKDTTAKLAACEAGLKRWHSRLTRAINMVAKLERQRRRLTPVKTLADRWAEKKADKVLPVIEPVTAATIDVDEVKRQLDVAIGIERLDLPTFLDRRKVKVDKKAMPLTGKAALDYIKPKRKKA